MTYGERLKRAMWDQRVTAKELSRATNITIRQIYRYRADESHPVDTFGDPNLNAHKIANALGIPIEEFFTNDEPLAA